MTFELCICCCAKYTEWKYPRKPENYCQKWQQFQHNENFNETFWLKLQWHGQTTSPIAVACFDKLNLTTWLWAMRSLTVMAASPIPQPSVSCCFCYSPEICLKNKIRILTSLQFACWLNRLEMESRSDTPDQSLSLVNQSATHFHGQFKVTDSNQTHVAGLWDETHAQGEHADSTQQAAAPHQPGASHYKAKGMWKNVILVSFILLDIFNVKTVISVY